MVSALLGIALICAFSTDTYAAATLKLEKLTIPGDIPNSFSMAVAGSQSGTLVVPGSPLGNGDVSGKITVVPGEEITVTEANADNNGTLQNFSILYRVENRFGDVIESGSTEDGSVLLINNNKDAVFDFTMPDTNITVTIINIKQALITVLKETVPENASQDFPFDVNAVNGGSGLVPFTVDGEVIDTDGDGLTNQQAFKVNNSQSDIYTVSEQVPAGWLLSDITCVVLAGDLNDGAPGVDPSIDLATAMVIMDIDNRDEVVCTYLNVQLGSITGTVTIDTDSDNLGDTPLGGIEVLLLDESGSAVLDENGTPVVAQTGVDGVYVFENLPPGNYQVVEVQPAGYSDVSEADGGDDADNPDNGIVNNIPVTLDPGEIDIGNHFVERLISLPDAVDDLVDGSVLSAPGQILEVDVLLNDSWGDDGPGSALIGILDPATNLPVSSLVTPSGGVVIVDDGGSPNDPTDDSLVYTAPDTAMATISETFQYQICDATLPPDCDIATVTISTITTPVTLGYFYARKEFCDQVVVRWQTVTETGNLGFNLYAKSGTEEWNPVNDQLLLSRSGDSVNTRIYSYTFAYPKVDSLAMGDVDVFGRETIHGPYNIQEQYGVERSNRMQTDWRKIKKEHLSKALRRIHDPGSKARRYQKKYLDTALSGEEKEARRRLEERQ